LRSAVSDTGRVRLPLDKHRWHPSVLPGPIVLVSTVDSTGDPNVAPKSWVSMMAFRGPRLAFGCDRSHRTAANVEATGEFVLNFPAEDLVERVWKMPASHGADRIRLSGLTLMPAREVAPPLIRECRAHLECRLEDTRRYGSEVVFFGTIVAGSIDPMCLAPTTAEQYFRLRPIFFLEDGLYGTIETARRVGAPHPTEQSLFIIELLGVGADAPVEEHMRFLRQLHRESILAMAGPFRETDGDRAAPTGMYALCVDSKETARTIALDDPLIRAGAGYTIRRWIRTF
jgi:flavin reductase (DIM6/NTAB) family NADH-FMN oxidoreductase RutF/uncharacterized protein YciI